MRLLPFTVVARALAHSARVEGLGGCQIALAGRTRSARIVAAAPRSTRRRRVAWKRSHRSRTRSQLREKDAKRSFAPRSTRRSPRSHRRRLPRQSALELAALPADAVTLAYHLVRQRMGRPRRRWRRRSRPFPSHGCLRSDNQAALSATLLVAPLRAHLEHTRRLARAALRRAPRGDRFSRAVLRGRAARSQRSGGIPARLGRESRGLGHTSRYSPNSWTRARHRRPDSQSRGHSHRDRAVVGRCAAGAIIRRKDAAPALVATATTAQLGLHSLFDFPLQIQAIALFYAAILGAGLAQAYSSGDRMLASGKSMRRPS